MSAMFNYAPRQNARQCAISYERLYLEMSPGNHKMIFDNSFRFRSIKL